ncbi:MAG: DNA polymerase III subunit chi [Gammaproteobacteria bacterium]
MTRVDFYVLESGGRDEHDRMICRVVEKAWQRGHEVYVYCNDDHEARAFDDLLWQFRDTSFVPHAPDGGEAPVIVGTRADAAASADVLVNLGAVVPEAATRFNRVVESAGHDAATRGAARERYRFYQDRGFPLQTHKIGG